MSDEPRRFALAPDSDFCGVSAGFMGPSCKWPHRRITWRQALGLPGLTAQQLQQGFAEGIAPWAEVADIEFVHLPAGTVNIEAVDHAKDGPDGVLADSMLPCNFTASMTANQRYDSTDRWPYERYVKVVRHEVGHALGISHISQRGNIMFPSLDMGVARLGPQDIAEITGRYGKRVGPVPVPPPPGPTPPPPPPGPTPAPTRRPKGLPLQFKEPVRIFNARHYLKCAGSVERGPGGGPLHPGIPGKVGERKGPWGVLTLVDDDGYPWTYWLSPE
jgi:hypothetical protein